jgi:pyrroloquinoline quinone (PQQ) biosynthesis protein C
VAVNEVPELRESARIATHATIAPPGQAGAALWLKITLAQELLNTAAQRVWSQENVARVFPSFLLELYSVVRCSVPLMAAACQRATELAETDRLSARTAAYLKQHIEEECNHDEWLLNDLVAGGMDRSTVLSRAPSAGVARLVGAQYCWIRHAHPAALFGYLAVIEGNPPLAGHLDEIQLLTGYPPETFRCLHLHAADDIEHLRELRATITELPLSETDAALIAASAFATLQGLVSVFEDLTKQQMIRE